MKIRELRILPPFAIGRLGSAKEPQDNYTIDDNPKQPLGYRRIVPAQTLKVNQKTGEITSSTVPKTIVFKIDGKIRPVAPFLEVFAELENPPKKEGAPEKLVQLDRALLEKLGASRAKIEWRVSVANRKVMRRTGNSDDTVEACTGWFSDHQNHVLKGSCKNFVPGGSIEFGHVRFICPNDRFGQIRLRFTPAQGLIYGPATGKRDRAIPPERAIYDADKDWFRFGNDPEKVANQTLPPSLYAIEPPAPSWLNNNIAISRGYFDDACDGFVEVRLSLPGGNVLTATARICSAPPAVVPDSLFIRSLADDLDQVIFGPQVPKEPYEVTRNRALDIVRRAYETVRFMNVAVMNGNNFNDRPALSLDSMPEEEAADTERAIRPVMAPGTVDTIGIMTLHEQVFAALRGGAAPWFLKLLRRPDEVADFTDRGRRKMPALMCGADNNYLALTYRQIDTIRRVALEAPFHFGVKEPEPEPEPLTALNLTAQLHHQAVGNPISSRPVTSVANCCPGLEVDFRAVWRRMFKGIVLREYDNLVIDVDPDVTDPAIRALVGQHLLRVRLSEEDSSPKFLMYTPIMGPASSDPDGEIRLTTQLNPQGIAPVEWSNALAAVLRGHQGKRVICDFTKDLPPEQKEMMQEIDEEQKNYITMRLEVRKFFDEGTAVISKVLANAGELTQGLCSPWQNDYRECSCYYWASARPDYINVQPAGNGLSKGDNWFQIERTGTYVPDDYADSRLVLYDELFLDWEHWLRFQVGGRDYMEEPTTEAEARPRPKVPSE
ncbi:MAG TPA: hypothetical protein VFN62_01310 [Acidobacteriaceae bacterium]|nr:hypothetical protein [Acidobacteriaceae bacterium]